jgi:hypothetical protein
MSCLLVDCFIELICAYHPVFIASPRPGADLWDDIRTLYRRARHGWAPRDVWSLDHYLNRELAGSLEHLAETTHGAPVGYPYLAPHIHDGDSMRPYRHSDDPNDVVTDHERWVIDLRRWAVCFRQAADDSDIFEDRAPFSRLKANSLRRRRVMRSDKHSLK